MKFLRQNAAKIVTPIFLLALILGGCDSWGGDTFKSDEFGYKFTFPPKWEYADRSDSSGDHLIATYPEDRESEIIVTTTRVSADMSSREVFLRFNDGGDDAMKLEFSLLEKGTISAKNLEGRFIVVEYLENGVRMKGIRAKFLGFKYTMEVEATTLEEKYIDFEADFKKMIRMIKFKG